MRKIYCILSLLFFAFNLSAYNLSVVGPSVITYNPSSGSFSPTTYYYTIMNGVYETNIWSHTGHTGASCGCNPGCSVPSNSVIYIAHVVTSNCATLDLGSNVTFIVEAGGSFQLSGNGSITGSGSIQVDNGGVMEVQGDITLNGAGSATINGTLNVYGSLSDLNGGGSVCGSSGTINVAGTISAGSVCPTYGGTLPVELTLFKGRALDMHTNLLEWQTKTEINNKCFIIEKSTDALEYKEIFVMKGAGNSNTTLNYNYVDHYPDAGKNYYRLKQVDYNGNYKYFSIVIIENKSDNVDITLFPNPSSGEVSIKIPENISGLAFAKIYVIDLLGRTIMESKVDYKKENLVVSFDLPVGVYNVTVELGELSRLTQSIIIR